MTIEEQARKRIDNVRSHLIQRRKFYGVLISQVDVVITRDFPTAATDGKRHYWNPEFVMTLTDEELEFVQCHESEHDARHHGTRRWSRDPVEWNVAGDYSINIDLIDEGIGKPPKGVLIDPKYRGMASEDIYRCRELDKQEQQKQEQQKQQEQTPPDDDGDEEGLDDADTNPPPPSNDEGDDSEGDDADDSEGDDSSDEGDDADGDEGDSNNQSNEEGDEGDDNGDGDSEGEGDDDSDTGNGSGSAADADDTEGDGDGDGEGTGTGTGKAEQQSSGDPGGCGEVLDSAIEDDSEAAEKDIEWERVVRQAASIAKAVGQLPGHITREIERANNPPRDWRDELREFAEESGALSIETWNRPNRRFAYSGTILPSNQKHGISKAVFIIDTSGSMDAIALACVRLEAQAMLDDGIIDSVVVLYGDTRLTREDTFGTGDEIEFDPKGGGGTDMKPLFAHVAEQHDDASMIICFTDLYIGSAGPEPHCPVLFAVTGYPDQVKTLIANAPWGARGIDVGAHC